MYIVSCQVAASLPVPPITRTLLCDGFVNLPNLHWDNTLLNIIYKQGACTICCKFLNGNMFEEAHMVLLTSSSLLEMQEYKFPFQSICVTDTVLLECLVRRYLSADPACGSA